MMDGMVDKAADCGSKVEVLTAIKAAVNE